MPLFFDSTMIILLPAIILTFYAQAKIQGAYSKYSRVASSVGLTGAAVARQLLSRAGIHDVEVEMIPGELTDHYDPRHKKLRLSPQVYNSTSIAAIGIAAHEAGHAIQHDTGYFPLAIRNSLAPVAQLGSNMAVPLLLIGLLIGAMGLVKFGIYAFVTVVLFQLITLPVEFNASSRAIALLEEGGYLTQAEVGPAKDVLSAAALTYVAAALTAILTLVRFLVLAGLARRDE